MRGSRLLSLDAFRGITVAAMVLVNNPGSSRAVYGPLQHADWHGVTPTDLVFPFFLFIAGVAVPLALGRRLASGEARSAVLGHVGRRSAGIFALGLLLHAVPGFDLAHIRIPGVLQRIAVCYLVAALVFLACRPRTEVAIAGAALLGYWAALSLVPVPGFGPGDLSKEGNLAAWIDRQVLGPHIWRVGRVYDPEGILSTVPAVATTLCGVLTGRYLASAAAPPSRAVVQHLLGAGLAASALGLAWGAWLPINKSLWTSSYALFTAGAATLALAACYWIVEVRGVRRWTWPFALYGRHALAAFFLSSMLARLLVSFRVPSSEGRGATLHRALFTALFDPLGPPKVTSLAWALAHVGLWLLVVYWIDRARRR